MGVRECLTTSREITNQSHFRRDSQAADQPKRHQVSRIKHHPFWPAPKQQANKPSSYMLGLRTPLPGPQLTGLLLAIAITIALVVSPWGLEGAQALNPKPARLKSRALGADLSPPSRVLPTGASGQTGSPRGARCLLSQNPLADRSARLRLGATDSADAQATGWSTSGGSSEIVWQCKSSNMTELPSQLEPKPELLLISDSAIVVLRRSWLQSYATTLRKFSIMTARQLTSVERDTFNGFAELEVVYIMDAPKLLSFDLAITGSNPRLSNILIQRTGLAKWPDLSEFKQSKILDSLDLDSNLITRIDESTFRGAEIGKLTLSNNPKLAEIHELAFSQVRNLVILDLSATAISTLPSEGLEHLRSLTITDTPTLKRVPSIHALPSLHEARMTYAYHCCSFRYPQTHDPFAHELYLREQAKIDSQCPNRTSTSKPLQSGETSASGSAATATTISAIIAEFLGTFESPTRPDSSSNGLKDDTIEATSTTHSPRAIVVVECGPLVDGAPNEARVIDCKPEADAFNPCEDIMGYTVLRLAVWAVLGVSVCANLAVIVVLVCLRHLTVPKFLQLNLAVADLLMGVYLLMLALADLATKGSYFNYALDWQEGVWCKFAGAATIFASQLSIYTLSVITFERYYTITYSIDLNMRIKLSWAVRLMGLGWLYASFFAILPVLANVNSYSKTSICLPMRTNSSGDVIFLLVMLIFDSTAFLIIFACYLKMYLLIRAQKTEASAKERTVALRMALLVFTDLTCWGPLVFFATTALLGHPLISVTNSKILIVFFMPLNSLANPFLYVLSTRQYRRDLNYLGHRWSYWRKVICSCKRPDGGDFYMTQYAMNHPNHANFINNQNHVGQLRQQHHHQVHFVMYQNQNATGTIERSTRSRRFRFSRPSLEACAGSLITQKSTTSDLKASNQSGKADVADRTQRGTSGGERELRNHHHHRHHNHHHHGNHNSTSKSKATASPNANIRSGHKRLLVHHCDGPEVATDRCDRCCTRNAIKNISLARIKNKVIASSSHRYSSSVAGSASTQMTAVSLQSNSAESSPSEPLKPTNLQGQDQSQNQDQKQNQKPNENHIKLLTTTKGEYIDILGNIHSNEPSTSYSCQPEQSQEEADAVIAQQQHQTLHHRRLEGVSEALKESCLDDHDEDDQWCSHSKRVRCYRHHHSKHHRKSHKTRHKHHSHRHHSRRNRSVDSSDNDNDNDPNDSFHAHNDHDDTNDGDLEVSKDEPNSKEEPQIDSKDRSIRHHSRHHKHHHRRHHSRRSRSSDVRDNYNDVHDEDSKCQIQHQEETTTTTTTTDDFNSAISSDKPHTNKKRVSIFGSN